jgi:hypothetical protein
VDKLDVVARAAAGNARSPGPGYLSWLRTDGHQYTTGAWINLSVTRAADGEPVKGLTQDNVTINYEWEGAAGPERAGIIVFSEETVFPVGLDGYYLVAANISGGGWWNRGVYFVQVVVRVGSMGGQTLTTLLMRPD